MNETFLTQRLLESKEKGLFRSLPRDMGGIDFCSNDYLGFARSSDFLQMLESRWNEMPQAKYGATGSRLISGNHETIENLETKIAAFHHAPAGLIFTSGYAANSGLLSALLREGDTAIYDESIHASSHDGMRLGKGVCLPFRHNDLDHLKRRLKLSTGKSFVIVESLYSMDGDTAPIEEISQLCLEFGARLIVDEAHATGISGPHGEGLVVEKNCADQVFARVHTFGKALGCHGAIVLGSQALKDFLINFSRPFIYSTGLPLHSLVAIDLAYDLLPKATALRTNLRWLVTEFRRIASQNAIMNSTSPIQSLLVPGNSEVMELARHLQQAGFAVTGIRSPTVKAGTERIRICLHAFNTLEEIDSLCECLRSRL